MKKRLNTIELIGLILGVIALPCLFVWVIARVTFNATFEKKKLITLHASKMYDEWKDNLNQAKTWVKANVKEEITIKSDDGIDLKAFPLPCDDPQRLVLVVEGWRSGWNGIFAPLARNLSSEGSYIIFTSNRAGNHSGGKYIGMGMLERNDIRRWVDYCHEHYPELPLYLCGVSMGSTAILLGAEASWDNKVSGIIADCGFTCPYDQVQASVKHNIHLPGYLIMDVLDIMIRRRMKVNMKEFDTRSQINECNVPILFIHGTVDSFISAKMTMENYQIYNGPKKLMLVKGAGHAECYQKNPKGYEDVIRKLFEGEV